MVDLRLPIESQSGPPACHAGGRGFESRRSRHFHSSCIVLKREGLWAPDSTGETSARDIRRSAQDKEHHAPRRS